MDVLEMDFTRVGGAEREFALLVFRGVALGIGRDNEPANRLGIAYIAGLGPNDRYRSLRPVGDPHLGAVEDPAILGLASGGDHPAGIGAEVGLGEAEASDGLALGERGQP